MTGRASVFTGPFELKDNIVDCRCELWKEEKLIAHASWDLLEQGRPPQLERSGLWTLLYEYYNGYRGEE